MIHWQKDIWSAFKTDSFLVSAGDSRTGRQMNLHPWEDIGLGPDQRAQEDSACQAVPDHGAEDRANGSHTFMVVFITSNSGYKRWMGINHFTHNTAGTVAVTIRTGFIPIGRR